LMAQRGVTGTYAAIRQWCNKYGLKYAQTLRRKH